MKSLIMIIALAFSSLAMSAGFKEGNRFEEVRIEGIANIICREDGQTARAYYQCSNNRLSPSVYGKFEHETDADVDRVNLTAIREDGTTRSKSQSFRNGEITSTL